MAEAERLVLAHVVDVGELGRVPHLLQQVVLARSRSSACSSSTLRSKWSSIACLLRPMTIRMSVIPACTASSTTYWIAGLSTTRQHLLRQALGRRQNPRPESGRRDHGLAHRVPSRLPRVETSSRRNSRRMLLAWRPMISTASAATTTSSHTSWPVSVDRNRERDRDEQRRERRLVQQARDDEPHDREADHDPRVEHGERAACGRDTLSALAIQRERVTEHRRDPEQERAGPPADPQPDSGRGRALQEVGEEHDQAPAPTQQAPDVRRARVAASPRA